MGKGAAKFRLAVAVCLFVGWIGWLAYLVATTHNPVIISRPQFIVADLWVRGKLDGDGNSPKATLVVGEVLWASDKQDLGLVDKQITVQYLDKVGKDLGWAGPGDYLLPLQKNKDAKKAGFRLAALPTSPGFSPAFQLIDPGTNTEEVAELIAQATGLDLQAAKDKVAHAPSTLKSPAQPEERFVFEKKLKELGATFSHEERRIYRATLQALEQVQELRKQEKQ
jgi:hypothetical protein